MVKVSSSRRRPGIVRCGDGGPDKPKKFEFKRSSGKRPGSANPFILYYLDTWKKQRGNIFKTAKACGKAWRALSEEEKNKYRRRYCLNQKKNSRACKKYNFGKGTIPKPAKPPKPTKPKKQVVPEKPKGQKPKTNPKPPPAPKC